jgi:SAM-dependent methyltransferase
MTTDSVGVRGARFVRRGIRQVSLGAARLGATQNVSRRLNDARGYWTGEAGADRWLSDSHWRGGLQDDAWLEVGRDHLAIFDQFAKALDRPRNLGAVVEWGCGGGANAVAFAPRADRFIAADVSADSVAECVRQINAVCDTAVQPLVIDIGRPEQAAAGLEGVCDVFLCLYVLELTAGPDEAMRIVKIAERLLASGGVAFLQVKYHNADWRTKGHKRNYRRNLANMTTFGIDEFWTGAEQCGLTPRLITLVPRNRLDVRYAYYALTKP